MPAERDRIESPVSVLQLATTPATLDGGEFALAAGIVVVMVLANAFFVATEFATIGARIARIEQRADDGLKAAERLLPILADPRRLDDYIAGCQVGITISSLALGAIAQNRIAPWVESRLAEYAIGPAGARAIAIIGVLSVLTTFQIVIGESVPKTIAMRVPERLALLTSRPMQIIMVILQPLIRLFNGAARVLMRAFGTSEIASHGRFYSPEEIGHLAAQSTLEGKLGEGERAMLSNALDLGAKKARQVMIPRNRLVTANVATPVDQLLTRVAACPFSRIPVYADSPDELLGIVHVKDLYRLHRGEEADIGSIVRPVPTFSEHVEVHRVWQALAQGRHDLAILLDEFGGTAGILTQEDLIEEIIGEVQDEFDEESARFSRSADGGVPLVRGDVLVADANDALGVRLPMDTADTVGGLVIAALGRVAAEGDSVVVDGVELRVTEVRGNWVARVSVLPLDSAESGYSDTPRTVTSP